MPLVNLNVRRLRRSFDNTFNVQLLRNTTPPQVIHFYKVNQRLPFYYRLIPGALMASTEYPTKTSLLTTRDNAGSILRRDNTTTRQ